MIKEEQHNVKEVWLNQTLEIPCLEDTASDNLSHYPLKWLVVSVLPFRLTFQKELQGSFADGNRIVRLYCVLQNPPNKRYWSCWIAIIKGKSINTGLQHRHHKQ